MRVIPILSNQRLYTTDSPTFANLTITGSFTTTTGNIIITDGGTIGQTAGPLLTFDDTLDYLEITGCDVGIGTATPGGQLDIVMAAANAELLLTCYHNTEATTPLLTMRKAEGTEASHASAIDDDAVLGTILFQGYDTNSWEDGAKIEARIQGEPSSGTDMPAELTFWTTPEASATMVERMTIDETGYVGIGTVGAAPGALLHLYKAATTGSSPLELLRLEVKDEGVELAAGMGPAINFYIPHDTASFLGASIAARKEFATDDTESTNLIFSTCPDTGSNTVRMRIGDTGFIGIGADVDAGTLLQLAAADAYLTLQNITSENGPAGAETKIIFEDHGNNALGQIEVSHVGSSDDEKGQFIISTNTDGGLTTALTISDTQLATFASNIVIPDTGYIGSTSVTTALRIEADGDILLASKLGVGITPAATIHAFIAATTASSPLEMLRLEVNDGGVELDAGMGPAINFYLPHNAASFLGAAIAARKESNVDDAESTNLIFSTCPDAGSSTIRMRIGDGGEVGVGLDVDAGTLLQLALDGNAYLTLQNLTNEHSEGGAETKIIFEDHGNNALAQIEGSHSGSADDTKGKMILSVNNASGLATAITIIDTLAVTFAGAIESTNFEAGNKLTACATNAGELDFTAASKKLDVEDSSVVSQDYTSDSATVVFAALALTANGTALTFKNDQNEHGEGGAESLIKFTDHTDAVLAQIEGSHKGTSDDTKGKLILSVHNNSSLTTAVTIIDTLAVTFAGAISATNYTAVNLLTACATNAGEIDFTAASKKLDVEDSAVVSQDYTSDASPSFANVGLSTGELTAGSINRGSGTLTLEIGGTAEISITTSASTFGGNIVIPDAGYIGSASATSAIQIETDGDLLIAGQLGIGIIPAAQLEISKDSANATLILSCFDNTEATTPLITLRKGEGTAASHATCVDDDAVQGTVLFQAYDGNSWANGAKIEARVKGAPGDGDVPSELTFWTTPDTSETLVEQMTIGPDGAVVCTGTIAASNYSAANLLTACASNAGGLNFSAASKTLTVADSCTVGLVIDDLNSLGVPGSDGQFIVATGAGAFQYEATTTARTSLGVGEAQSPTFANVSLTTGELTTGSINRASGTLTLEINGTAEVSITTSASTFGGNIVIPDTGAIGSASAPTAVNISATGIVDIALHNAATIGLALAGTLVTSTAAELNLLDGITAVQEHGDELDDLINVGTVTGDSYFLVGTGAAALAWETTTDARTSMGVGTGNSVQFASLKLGTANLKSGALFELAEDAANAELVISCYHDTEATSALLTLRKADNNESAPALVDDTAVLGTINFDGYDGTDWHTGAQIKSIINGTPSDGTDMPTDIVIYCCPEDSATLGERFRFGHQGAMTCTGSLEITGVLTASYTGGTVLTAAGATTGISLFSITNTGGDLAFGVERSTGGGVITGSLAYSSFIRTGTNTALHFGTTNAIRMTILGDGKVGIMDVAPAEALDVSGNVNVTGVYKVGDVQVVTSPQTHIVDAATQDLAGSDNIDETKLEADMAGFVTTINAILSALETHGLLDDGA